MEIDEKAKDKLELDRMNRNDVAAILLDHVLEGQEDCIQRLGLYNPARRWLVAL